VDKPLWRRAYDTVERPLATRLRRYAERGGRVAAFGAESLRRGVTVSPNRLERPTQPTATDAFAARLRSLLQTADLSEAICFLRGLPLYPDPALHLARAREGARSGMRPVFEAVAHANPYPAEVFDEAGWNQLVLKALFIETALAPIQGLDRRANPTLARMLRDYAHERWAAGRRVSPELWRCVGPFADGAAREDLARVLRTGDEAERAAARAALDAAPAAAA